ncbi:hypothetical protein Taro_056068 [Colocasia esculenta]|uniref:Uncharacterized protein n=1 Tax=Colocasia esculenta TaxID=4460 RepID=A0A843XSJ5_COLES|nr:hypothetical protein [Colocasia esculenta]
MGVPSKRLSRHCRNAKAGRDHVATPQNVTMMSRQPCRSGHHRDPYTGCDLSREGSQDRVPDATVIHVAVSFSVACWSRAGSPSLLAVAPGQRAVTVFCRVALSGRLTCVRVVGAGGLRCRSATASPSLSSSYLSPLLRRWGGSPPAIGAWWLRRARGGVVARAWSEEEVANRREGPLVGSFFMKVSRRDRVAVATRCLVASGFVSWRPSPSRCQRFGVVLVVLPRRFAQCLALEGLPRSEVVSISWDPHPREPVEGGAVLLVVFGAFEHVCIAKAERACVCLALTGCELWLRCIAWLPCVLVEVSQNYLLLS